MPDNFCEDLVPRSRLFRGRIPSFPFPPSFIPLSSLPPNPPIAREEYERNTGNFGITNGPEWPILRLRPVLKLCNRPIIIMPTNRAAREIHIQISHGKRRIAELFNVIGGNEFNRGNSACPRSNILGPHPRHFSLSIRYD